MYKQINIYTSYIHVHLIQTAAIFKMEKPTISEYSLQNLQFSEKGILYAQIIISFFQLLFCAFTML